MPYLPYHDKQNMPSFQDSAVIFFIALLLFGPKKLPELARYVGKMMNEFRRASSEFRMQMEDEFRQVEQVENQKKLAAIEAAAPITPAVTVEDPPIAAETMTEYIPEVHTEHGYEAADESVPEPVSTPLPIATNGDLSMMPPATGLPVARSAPSSDRPSSLDGLFDAIPQTPDPAAIHHESETSAHG